MYSKEEVIEALRNVTHPEKGSDIVTLGIVSDVTVTDEGIKILLTPEKSNDPFLSSIKSNCVRALKDALGPDAVISSIDVRPKIVVSKIKEPGRDVLPGSKKHYSCFIRQGRSG